MPYIINKSVNSEKKQRSFIDVGIHENVELKSVELKTSPNNNPFLVFTFEKEGETLTHTEYEPKSIDGKVLEDKQKNQMIRLKHIATKYIKEDDFVIEVMSEDFQEFARQYIKLLGNKYVGVKVRIKVVYNNNNYTSLPKYVPFIERMDGLDLQTGKVEKSQIKILSIDKMTKDTPDKITGTQNPYSVDLEDLKLNPISESEREDENELPF